MYPIRYTAFPFNRKLMMSLCHSWFGVLRSKNRGLPGFLVRRLLTGLSISSASRRVRCTVPGLALIRKNRFNTSLILRTPQPGFLRFSSTMLAPTAPLLFGAWRCLCPAPPGITSCLNPASP